MEQYNRVYPQDFELKFRSKQDLYSRLTKDCAYCINYSSNIGQYYLPSFRRCSISFIKDLFSGEKYVKIQTFIYYLGIQDLRSETV